MAKVGKGGILGCTLRSLLVCLVPVTALVLDMSPGVVVAMLSLLSVLFEGALLAMRSQGGRGKGAKKSIRPAGFFPLQLVGLYMLQLWCLMVHVASADVPNDGERPFAGGLRGNSANLAEPAPALPRAAGPGEGFELDAPLEILRWAPRNISVVLPCAEEREYALKTVRSVFDGTPGDVLHEIVVVDDGSEPPLASTHLGEEVQKQYRVKLLRHEETVGLIDAKQTGGDVATGDIVVFFDCHVAPQPGWHRDFLQLIGENYRRMVVPHITTLDVDTWTQRFSGGGLAKCYLTWDADFKWLDSYDPYIPVISGGLLGISRRWWRETGGYDTEMLGWGGENLDQSLRMWLCGGEIMIAPQSEVAHMWRDGSAKTRANYKLVGDTQRNRARAVYAWYGEFAEKLSHYPAFAGRQRRAHDGLPWYGNLSGFQAVRRRLHGCRPFAWFLRRFRSIYEDGGLLPKDVFMLREETSRRCLLYEGSAGTSQNGRGTASLQPCDEKNHRFFWHLGNVDQRARGCCSGLRAWNTDQCLQRVEQSGKASTGVCSVAGGNPEQEWALRSDGHLTRGGTCLGPGASPNALAEDACLSFRSRGGATWTKQSGHEPVETQLYRRALRDHPETFKALEGAEEGTQK